MLTVAAGPQADIFQGDAIFQLQQSQSFGKGLGESPCALKLGSPRSLKCWRSAPLPMSPADEQEQGLIQGLKYRAWQFAVGCC